MFADEGSGTGNEYSPQRSYTGREPDPATGLIYYRARWFDPKLGRFISNDPIDFAAGDANLSRYVGNSTPNAVDPSGLDELSHLYPENSAITPEIPTFEVWRSNPSYHAGTVISIASLPEDVWDSYVQRYGDRAVYLFDRAHRWGYTVVLEEDKWSSWIDGGRVIHVDSDWGCIFDSISDPSITAQELYGQISGDKIHAPSTLSGGLSAGHLTVSSSGGLTNQHAGLSQGAGTANDLIRELEKEVAFEAATASGAPHALALLGALVDKAKDAKRAARLGNRTEVCAPNRAWKSSNAWDTAKNSKLLRENMGDAIKAGEDAHHIVQSTHARAGAARKLLDKYQIDINDAVNGVGLKPSGPKPAHHGHGLHSHDAIRRVTERLEDAVSGVSDSVSGRKALLDELAKLKGEIAGGQFP